MDSNRLAVFVSQYGYTEAEQLTGIDADLLQKAIAGERLSDYEEALIDNGYSNLQLYESDYVDFDSINKDAAFLSEDVQSLALFQQEPELYDSLLESVSFNQIDMDDLREHYGLFANLSYNQADKLFAWLEDDEKNEAKEFFEAYELDGDDFWDIDESAFWEWFREVFYE